MERDELKLYKPCITGSIPQFFNSSDDYKPRMLNPNTSKLDITCKLFGLHNHAIDNQVKILYKKTVIS